MAQTAAERQRQYRRRQREQAVQLQARNAILEAFVDSFCSTCGHHRIVHNKRCTTVTAGVN